MSFRLKWIIAAPLVALLASACSEDVTQVASGTFVRATFDSTKRVIPTPNDLVLQGAPSLTDPDDARRALRDHRRRRLRGDSRAPRRPRSLSVINIPYELVVDGVATTATSAIDPASINSTTVAIVRVSGARRPRDAHAALRGKHPDRHRQGVPDVPLARRLRARHSVRGRRTRRGERREDGGRAGADPEQPHVPDHERHQPRRPGEPAVQRHAAAGHGPPASQGRPHDAAGIPGERRARLAPAHRQRCHLPERARHPRCRAVPRGRLLAALRPACSRRTRRPQRRGARSPRSAPCSRSPRPSASRPSRPGRDHPDRTR